MRTPYYAFVKSLQLSLPNPTCRLGRGLAGVPPHTCPMPGRRASPHVPYAWQACLWEGDHIWPEGLDTHIHEAAP